MERKFVIAHMPYNDKDCIMAVLFEDKNPVEIYIYDSKTESMLNNIYLGHVSKVLPQNSGVFVRFDKKQEGFLPYRKTRSAVIKNKDNPSNIKAEDELLVLVESEAIKTKPPGLTAELRITGDNFIICSSFNGANYSHKLDKNQNMRLREIMSKVNSEYGFIVRTHAAKETEDMLLNEAKELDKKIDDIIKKGISRTTGTCIYKADPMWLEKIKQLSLSEEISVVTDDSDIYNDLIAGSKSEKVKLSENNIRFYEDKLVDLYKIYNYSTIIDRATQKKVWLKSGASIVIEQTEAFVCIDINSSKAQKKKTSKNEFYDINIEAAKEIARQMRLRQLSGTILIDFINMNSKELDRKLLDEVNETVRDDDVNVIDITPLGIMELTRKKRMRSLFEQLSAI